MLLAPLDMSLREATLNGKAGLEAGLSDERKGRYAGYLWCTPGLSSAWSGVADRA